MDRDFVHLHNHMEGSIADSALRIKDAVKRAKEMGMKALALTDHGYMYMVLNFYKACKAQGIKPILGVETYVAPRRNTLKEHRVDDANHHLVLLCENNTGYQNLITLMSDAATSGMYYRPRTDKFMLRKHHEGIIALSACLGGSVQEFLLEKGYDEGKAEAIQYDEIFGRGNFFLELQNHGMEDQQKVNEMLLQIHRETGIPVVATNDCHYLTNADAEAHDVLMAVQAKTTIYDTKRKKYPTDKFYMRSQEEMWELFGDVESTALTNTIEIAERCNVEIEFGKSKIPEFETPEGWSDNFEFLTHLTYQGAQKRYGEITEDIKERIEFELSVIKKMNYIDYFLIVWDFVSYGRSVDMLVGPGRGSACGSIVMYSLEVTEIDPIRYGLLFERFLDPSRVSMPDVDIDWPDDRRAEIIEYVTNKYGQESVCQIITYGTMAAKKAVRTIGKALNVPLEICDVVAKMIPKELGIKLADAIERNAALQSKIASDERVKKIIDVSLTLEGIPINVSTHPAGVLISGKEGINSYVPTSSGKKGIVSQYEMGILDDLFMLKMDFLGLKNLTIIKNSINFIKDNFGIEVDPRELFECNYTEPLKVIGDGFTEGIFQLEGAGMTNLMKKLNPKHVEEIIAGIALYRPGPMQYIPQYLENRRDEKNIKLRFESLRPILQNTYGVIVYQESCMQIVMEIAGYQKHHSDSFRKAISKKKADLVKMHRDWFIYGRKADGKQDAIPGGIALGYPKEELEAMYDEMEEFGKYSFNKSHAAGYAAVSMACAWLKYYYPVEFICALINSAAAGNDYAKVNKYLQYANSKNIKTLPPDINTSNAYFIPTKNGEIVFSMVAKHTSEDSITEIFDERQQSGEFSDIKDFLKRCSSKLDKKTFLSLTAIGALDGFEIKRSVLTTSAESWLSGCKKYREKLAKPTKFSIKKTFDDYVNLQDIDKYDEYPEIVKFNMEKIFSGSYISGHPLGVYKRTIDRFSNFNLVDMGYYVDEETGEIFLNSEQDIAGKSVQFAAVLSDFYKTQTKKNKEDMLIAKVEDLTGSAKILIFPERYEESKDYLWDGGVYKISAEISAKPGEEPVLFCQKISPISSFLKDRNTYVLSSIEEVYSFREDLIGKQLERSTTPTYVQYGHMNILLPQRYWSENLNYKMRKERY